MGKKANELGISLVRELDTSLPQVTVDPDGLHTCLVNLVTNAIEAFPKPDSGSRVIVSSSDAAEGGICLRVRDTGQGMSEEIKEQVFENLLNLGVWHNGDILPFLEIVIKLLYSRPFLLCIVIWVQLSYCEHKRSDLCGQR